MVSRKSRVTQDSLRGEGSNRFAAQATTTGKEKQSIERG
jgi:hypothetical protein